MVNKEIFFEIFVSNFYKLLKSNCYHLENLRKEIKDHYTLASGQLKRGEIFHRLLIVITGANGGRRPPLLS